MKGKKSQITLYIIIGLLVVIFTGLLVYVIKLSHEPAALPGMQQLPADILAIKNYVDGCVSQTAADGIRLLGKNGGYINPENLNIETSPTAYDSDALLYPPDTIPYWNFIDRYNRLRSLRPSLHREFDGDNSIEDQIANYVEQNLKNCTGSFEAFSDSFNISSGTVSAEVSVRDQDVAVTVIYPLGIVAKSNQSATEIKDFSSTVDVHLKQVYDLASSLTAAEQKYHFIESMTMNMVSVYSDISENALPPTSSLKLGRDKVVWARSEVEELLKNDLLGFVQLIQIKNSLNYNPLIISQAEPDYQLKQGLYNSFNYQLEDKNDYNVTAEFFYPQSPIYLSINDEEIIMPRDRIPSNIVTDMLGLQIQDYAFEYDISYPVIVKLRDPKAFSYRGYEFQFSLEANIRDNTPVNASMLLQSQNIPTSKIDINKPGQLVAEPLTIRAVDRKTNSLLEDVQVYYKCGQKVYMGKTGKTGTITASFPYCLAGGKIIYSREGYLGSAASFNNNENRPASFDIYLYPKVKFDVIARKRTLQNINALAGSGPLSPVDRKVMELEQAQAIGPQEKVVMVLQKQRESSDEESLPVPNFLIFNPNLQQNNSLTELRQNIEQQYSSGQISLDQKNKALQALQEQESAGYGQVEEKNTIELVPGNYTVEAYLLNYNGTSIPEKIEKVGVWPFEKEVTYPSQNFSIWQNGGASFNTTLTEEDIYSGSTSMVLYVFDTGVPKTWDELSNYKPLDYYSQYNYQLKPAFIMQGAAK